MTFHIYHSSLSILLTEHDRSSIQKPWDHHTVKLRALGYHYYHYCNPMLYGPFLLQSRNKYLLQFLYVSTIVQLAMVWKLLCVQYRGAHYFCLHYAYQILKLILDIHK